jgi:hypothetical protein
VSEAEGTAADRAASLAAWSPGAAESFRELANDLGFQLDYSAQSLSEVERMITEEFSDRSGVPKEKFHDLVGATGAYVAEVILRNVGGEWGFEPEFEAGGIQLPSGTWVFPLHKSRKRFEEGPGDDFVSYYTVLERGRGDCAGRYGLIRDGFPALR